MIVQINDLSESVKKGEIEKHYRLWNLKNSCKEKYTGW